MVSEKIAVVVVVVVVDGSSEDDHVPLPVIELVPSIDLVGSLSNSMTGSVTRSCEG